jgi:hypothetical protein
MQNLKCVDLHHACTIVKKDVKLFISPYVPIITTNKALGLNDRNVKLTLASHACTHVRSRNVTIQHFYTFTILVNSSYSFSCWFFMCYDKYFLNFMIYSISLSSIYLFFKHLGFFLTS